ncbi:hypothetical protein [Rhodoferax antarcticus]|uniref:hypothetical protein n=1 Tax=Rhodoferax antarcticus TaxID=81479 RepID=UPI0012EBAFF1|nr:hypothetical protein [Rhodoferax antarcticus]
MTRSIEAAHCTWRAVVGVAHKRLTTAVTPFGDTRLSDAMIGIERCAAVILMRVC